jgi:hypothetical protein
MTNTPSLTKEEKQYIEENFSHAYYPDGKHSQAEIEEAHRVCGYVNEVLSQADEELARIEEEQDDDANDYCSEN